MIGDHHQLPPVIKNMAFQKFSNMEQSLFTRFVHLGVPTVDLDAQGRARPRSDACYCALEAVQSIVISMLCLSHNSKTAWLNLAFVWSFSDGVAICYVLPVLWGLKSMSSLNIWMERMTSMPHMAPAAIRIELSPLPGLKLYEASKPCYSFFCIYFVLQYLCDPDELLLLLC